MQRCVLITGASKGIGQAIAAETNKKFVQNTLFVLIARDKDRLNQVKQEMNAFTDKNKVVVISYDFSQHEQVEQVTHLLSSHLIGQDLSNIKELYVFYNHGTFKMEMVAAAADHAPAEFQTNVLSVWTLLAAVRNMFSLDQVPTQFHVNISSLLATKVGHLCSLYSTSNLLARLNFHL